MRIAETTSGIDRRALDPVAGGRLQLGAPDRSARTWVSAASGLAAAGGAAWVVSDEYGELVRFDALYAAGQLLPGLAHQKRKPDLESLLRVPQADGGSLLVAFGSGSADDGTRDSALAQHVDATGTAVGKPQRASLKHLYSSLGKHLPHGVNIEGLALRDAAQGPELLAFHRGQLAGDHNTIFRLDAARAVDALQHGDDLGKDLVLGSVAIDLGTLGGAPLGFADAKTLADGRIVFVASAEGAPINDADGPILGSVVGILDHDLNVQSLRPLTGPARKVEGIELARALDPTAPVDEFVLVTDPDDPKLASEVLRVRLDG